MGCRFFTRFLFYLAETQRTQSLLFDLLLRPPRLCVQKLIPNSASLREKNISQRDIPKLYKPLPKFCNSYLT